MNAPARALAIEPILHTAAGEPPLAGMGRFFRDDQGAEIFEPDKPQHRSSAAIIGILELEGGRWLARVNGFPIDGPQFATREAALRCSIARAIRTFRYYARNKEGLIWEPAHAGRMIEWALSVKPVAGSQLRQGVGKDADQGKDRQARPDPSSLSSGKQTTGDHTPEPPQAEAVHDPLIRELVAQHKARKIFPAGHTVTMTNPAVNGEQVTLGTCECGDVFSFPYNRVGFAKMDAAIELHLQKFDALPDKVDGQGAPITNPDDRSMPVGSAGPGCTGEMRIVTTTDRSENAVGGLGPALGVTARRDGADISSDDDWLLRAAAALAWRAEDDEMPTVAIADRAAQPRAIESYRKFLEGKIKLAAARGFDVDPADINPALRPHVKLIVPWMARLGRAALFTRFGMQKTSTQLELGRLVLKRRSGPWLTVLPLGARLEFFKDADRWFKGGYAVRTNFVRRTADLRDDAINLTNFESVREGNVDPSACAAASLDEGDILRSFGGTKTFREFMRVFESVPFRFVATATPDPNEYIELLSYAGFLDIMDIGQAKTRFFKRDSERADKLTLHPHKADEFWIWVGSWALFAQRPSDIDPSLSDEGYDLPPLDVRWHELPTDHGGAGSERDGQGKMFRDSTTSVVAAAREKRDSLSIRVEKMLQIRAEDPAQHRIVWHDLEAEREAIERAAPEIVTVYGSQDLEEREKSLVKFANGEAAELAGKPMMIGAGSNFQHHCWWAIFLGIGHKFKDFIQAVHRLQRYGQAFEGFRGDDKRVRIDMIYTEAEREIRRNLEDKWRRYQEQADRMSEVIRRYGLAHGELAKALTRSIGVERIAAAGETWSIVNNDCVEECMAMAANSVDLIVTSIPFETQYEYTPSYNDFGHSDSRREFWQQMDFLIPQLLRVLKPGRNAVIHVKDRIVPGGMTGLGFQTVSPTSDDCTAHFTANGFAFLGRKVVTTDVVRENAQTDRLGWTEQCKDGTRMGPGMSEYLLIFRRPQSDATRGYADKPVIKLKPLCDDHGTPAPFDKKTNWRHPLPNTGYSRARWQLDAHGFMPSSGDCLLSADEVRNLPHATIYKLWKARSLDHTYDFVKHLAAVELMDHAGRLPSSFMLLPPHSKHPDVWSDVARMRTLNTFQAQKGKEGHLCPLPLDIVDRVITQYSMEGETVFDPFAGLGTVPSRAVLQKRRGLGVELSPTYFKDAAYYCDAAEKKIAVPSLFTLLGIEDEIAAALADDAANTPPLDSDMTEIEA